MKPRSPEYRPENGEKLTVALNHMFTKVLSDLIYSGRKGNCSIFFSNERAIGMRVMSNN